MKYIYYCITTFSMSDDQSELMEADMTSQMTDDKLSMGSKGTHSYQGSPGMTTGIDSKDLQ